MRLSRFRSAMARPGLPGPPRFLVTLAYRHQSGLALTHFILESSDLFAAEDMVRRFNTHLDVPLAGYEVIPYDDLLITRPQKSMPSPWAWRNTTARGRRSE